MNNSYITIIKEKRTALSRKRIPLNQNECTADSRIGVPFEQNLQFSLEAEIHHYIDILEPVLRDAGQEMWQALDRIISAKNAMEGIVAKEMYIRGFLDYERLV